jgi:hypothetical protein
MFTKSSMSTNFMLYFEPPYAFRDDGKKSPPIYMEVRGNYVKYGSSGISISSNSEEWMEIL